MLGVGRIAAGLIAFWGLAACVSGATIQNEITPEMLEAQPAYEYRLAPGDALNVEVFGQPQLSGDTAVDNLGMATLPLIGAVQADGLTIPEFADAVEDKLSPDYVIDPTVRIQVTNYRPYFIFGEVGNPGQYPYVAGMTVMRAIVIAGGFTDRSNTRSVYITRAGTSGSERVQLTPATPLLPGDTVEIRERFF